MRRSFLANKAPVLTGVIKEKTPAEAISSIQNATMKGAKGIDLHLQCLERQYQNSENIKKIVDSTHLPIFGLNYASDMTEEERISLLMASFEAGTAGFDMQGYTFDIKSKSEFNENFVLDKYSFTKYRPKEVVLDNIIIDKQCDIIERVHHSGGEILLSNHIGIYMPSDALVELAIFLEERKPDTIKFVTMCDTEDELSDTLRAMILMKKEVKTPVTLICNGKYRALTRILNPMLGGYMVFVNDGYKFDSTLGQLELGCTKQMLEAASAQLFAIDGMNLGEIL